MGTLPLLKESITLRPLEILSGLFDICTAVQFLHERANLVHLNISPSSIFVSADGRWSLGGFRFSASVDPAMKSQPQSLGVSFQFSENVMTSVHFNLAPRIEFTAPEILSRHPPLFGTSSDLYSIGLLILYLSGLLPVSKNSAIHLQTCRQFDKQSPFSALPDSIRPLEPEIRSALNWEMTTRPSISDILKSSYFVDVGLQALRYFDSLDSKEDKEKIVFFNKFLLVLKNKKFDSENLLRYRCLPILLKHAHKTILFDSIIPLIFEILNLVVPPDLFATMYDQIKHFFTAPQISVESVCFLLRQGNFLYSTGLTQAQKDLQKFIIRCIEVPHQQVAECALAVLPTVAQSFSPEVIEKSLLPLLLRLIAADNEKAVQSLAECCHVMEYKIVVQGVIPVIAKYIDIKAFEGSSVSKDTADSVFIMCRHMLATYGDRTAPSFVLPLLVRCMWCPNCSFKTYEDSYKELRRLFDAQLSKKKAKDNESFSDSFDSIDHKDPLPYTENKIIKTLTQETHLSDTLSDLFLSLDPPTQSSISQNPMSQSSMSQSSMSQNPMSQTGDLRSGGPSNILLDLFSPSSSPGIASNRLNDVQPENVFDFFRSPPTSDPKL
eukprot:GHVP01063580.1.p1 GENE.GHVP01063580.1~~GHVP01063580.1.p1  ORF type:complete len:607 (+),score=98.93 GHVP01063580.1:360-2180(+)